MAVLTRHEAFDPCKYTSGSWLDRDGQRKASRYIDFDFSALMKEAISCCSGARRIVDCRKAEGGFNKLFFFVMDNGARVVARLPTRLAGPPTLTTHSEVATLRFVKQRTSIPVPDVLKWSNTRSNPVGVEYIIMSHVQGVSLMEKWPQMNGLQHIECIAALGAFTKELASLSFPAYGSLYFNDAQLSGTTTLDNSFCIGPHCGTQFWDPSIQDNENVPQRSRGPWHDVASYLDELVNTGYESSVNQSSGHQGSLDDHLALLKANRRCIDLLAQSELVQNASGPTLFHPDFHTRNILVDEDDPTKITGIIDWQSASIEPALLHAAETPDFAEPLLFDRELDGNRKAPETDTEKDHREDVERCIKAWTVLVHVSPKVGKAAALDDSILRVLTDSHTAWKTGRAAVRSQLMDLAQRWADLGLPGNCPYHPNAEELELQKREFDDLESTQRLRFFLARALGCDTDGWVAADRWDDVLPRYRDLYKGWMESAKSSHDPEYPVSPEKADKLWPFDGR
ncbi:hypothetical protein FH972_023367 [Carpinus fangiana]|uniref:Altered inheritance of mitochondria protein 9, mitochondrial n=1 Tax=Carpinus fangiana TaxID=176857 RepID=A0A5N6KVG6_9ROSI|nr:hypothetical protein FH972_023367 [Carpinus fangiana]